MSNRRSLRLTFDLDFESPDLQTLTGLEKAILEDAINNLRHRWLNSDVRERITNTFVSSADEYEESHPAAVTFDDFKRGIDTAQWSAKVTWRRKYSTPNNMVIALNLKNLQRPFTYTYSFTRENNRQVTYTCTVGNIARRRLMVGISGVHKPYRYYEDSEFGPQRIKYLRFYSTKHKKIVYQPTALTTGNPEYRKAIINLGIDSVLRQLRRDE